MDKETEAHREERLHALWRQLDPKKTGSLDLASLKEGLTQMQHPLRDADALLREVLTAADIDRDGKISYDEFRRFCTQTEKQLWQLFKAIDRDHSGELDKAELSAAFERAGLTVSNARVERFFNYIDKNRNGTIDFSEWRDFLLFLPTTSPGLKAVFNYYQTTTKLTAEGDVHMTEESVHGIGYFIAGGSAGIVSRTSTAPLDRLKVYLIAQTDSASDAVQAVKSGNPAQALSSGGRTLWKASKELWAAGGIRSLFAGNGINIIKVMPESGVKFAAYEASKKLVAKWEGHNNTKKISSWAIFVAGGVSGMVAQAVVYPLDTLKFRMQCETVAGGDRGNVLLIQTAKKMWAKNGVVGFYRGLPMGLVGMFPYAAIDLGVFESFKNWSIKRNRRLHPELKHDEDALPGNFTLAIMGGFSGAIGASAVYPLNLLRTRLQSQGTSGHPRTYTGIVDVTRQTLKGEGVRGLFKGLVPNLLKVVPAVSITYVVYENSKRMLHLT